MSGETADRPRSPRWLPAASLALGLGLLAWVLRASPLDEVSRAVRGLGPGFLLTVLVALGWHACNTKAFAVLVGDRLSFGALLWNRLVGDAYNNLLPLLGLGGEPFKLRHLSMKMPADEAALALIRDRVVESVFGLSFTGLTLVYTLRAVTLPRTLRVVLVLVVVLAALGSSGAVLLMRSSLPSRLAAVAARLLGPATTQARGMRSGQLLRMVAWHLPARMLGWVELWVLFHLLGLPTTFAGIVLVDNFLYTAGLVGFFVPQGLGVAEGATVYAMALLGEGGTEAVALALARRGRALLVGLFGVGLHLLALRKRR